MRRLVIGQGGTPLAAGTLYQLSPGGVSTGIDISNPANVLMYPCISPDGRNLYLTTAATGYMWQWSRDLGTGLLTPLATPKISSVVTVQLIFSSDGKFAYGCGGGYDKVYQFSRNTTTGHLTPLTPNGVTGTLSCNGLIISPDDRYVYTCSKGSNVIYQLSRDSNTGLLTLLSANTVPVPAGSQAGLMVMSPNVVNGVVEGGKHVYVAYFGTSSPGIIGIFNRDIATGQLTAAGTGQCVTQPHGLAISPDGKNLYVANDNSTFFSQLSRNLSDGSLSPLSPATLPAGAGQWNVAITPDGKYVYVADSDGGTISQYARDAATGLLSVMNPPRVRHNSGSVPANASAGGPNSVVVSPDGKHLYASAQNVAMVTQFGIRQ